MDLQSGWYLGLLGLADRCQSRDCATTARATTIAAGWSIGVHGRVQDRRTRGRVVACRCTVCRGLCDISGATRRVYATASQDVGVCGVEHGPRGAARERALVHALAAQHQALVHGMIERRVLDAS